MNIFAIKGSWWVSLIIVLVLCFSFTTSLAPVIAYAQGTPPATPAAPATPPTGTCSKWYSIFVDWSCLGKIIGSYASSTIIYLTGWILGIAGVLLNASIELTTVGFNSQIYNRIQGGIEAVWTVFRDIANIVIIGMFTFIALSMILGIEKYNARQMVAKVLLIAVLINFSLLFTRTIIESSNFLAIQFYKAAQVGVTPGVAGAAGADFSVGISGKFAQLLGVTSFAEQKDAMWAIAEKNNSGLVALALGILTAVVMIVAALFFFYIAFLLIARAVLFVFLLITSSLAFASYLLPSEGFGGYGWSSWWNALLKNAVFAPLLLMMLWATVKIGENIKAISGSGTLGGLLVDPGKGGNVNALFSYLLIIGMLYVSIRVATSFSHKIGGFDYAKMAPGFAAAFGSRLTGALARNSIGGLAFNRSKAYDKKIADAMDAGNARKAARLAGRKALMDSLATKDFNAMNMKKFGIGDKLGKTLGVSGSLFDGKSAGGGYAGLVKEKAKADAERFRSAAMSEEKINKQIAEKKRDAEEQRTQREEMRATARDSERQAREEARDERAAATNEKRDADENRRRVATEHARAVQDHERVIREREREVDRAERRGENSDEAIQARASHQAALNERDAINERARQAAQEHGARVTAAQTRLTNAERALQTLGESERVAEQEHKEAIKTLKTQALTAEQAEATRIKEYHERLNKRIEGNKYLSPNRRDTNVAAGIQKEIGSSGTVKRLKEKITELDRKIADSERRRP